MHLPMVYSSSFPSSKNCSVRFLLLPEPNQIKLLDHKYYVQIFSVFHVTFFVDVNFLHSCPDCGCETTNDVATLGRLAGGEMVAAFFFCVFISTVCVLWPAFSTHSSVAYVLPVGHLLWIKSTMVIHHSWSERGATEKNTEMSWQRFNLFPKPIIM